MKVSLLLFCLAIILSAERLTLTDFEKKVIDNGYVQQMDSIDDLARKWEKRKVIAGYLPDLTFNGSVLHLSKEYQEAQQGSIASFSQFIPGMPQMRLQDTAMVTYDFTLNQPITNGGIEIVAIKIAQLTKAAQEIGYAIHRDEAIVLARKKYFELLKLEEQIELTQKDLNWNKAKLREATIRFETNVLPETDLLKWQSSVLSIESNLNKLISMRAGNYALIKHYMGEVYSSGEIIELDSFEQFEEWYNTLEVDEIDLSKSKIISQMELYTKVSDKNSTVTLTNALPKLNAFMTYSRSRFKDDDYSGGLQAGLQLSVPLFTGLRNVTAYREKKFESIKSKVELEKIKSELQASAIELKNYCESARGTVESIQKQHALNKKNVEIMTERYTLGQVSQSDLMEMRNAVSFTRLEYVTNILDILYYYTEYQNLLGILEVN